MNLKTLPLISFFLLVSSSIWASESGQLIGRVIDKATKQPLVGADIIIVGTETGATTTDDGIFMISDISENVYKLEVHYLGYQRFLETDVRVIRNKTTRLNDIELVRTPIEGEEVVTTSSLFSEYSEAPVSFYTYNREEIRRAPGATGDVFRAVETLPGVSTSGGEFSAFSVRGGNPRENIILIDNIPFDKVSHFNGGSEEQEKQGGRFSIFAPNLIEEMRFQAGGFSAQYGGKNASFMDLKLKEGNLDDATVDARFDITGWEVNYDGPAQIAKNTALVLSARHTDFTNILEWTGQKDFGSPRFSDFILKSTTHLNAQHKISFLGIHAPENFDKRVEHVLESDNFASNDIVDFDETKSLAGLNWQWLTGTNSVLESSYYLRYTDRAVSVGTATPLVPLGQPNAAESDFKSRWIYSEDNTESEFGTRTIFTWVAKPNLSIITGLEASRTQFDNLQVQDGLDTLYVFDQNDFRPNPDQNYVIISPEFVNSHFDNSRTQLAAFLETGLDLGPKLTLNSGVRIDHDQFRGDSYVAPRLSALYRVNSTLRFNAAGGIYYQIPEFTVISRALNRDQIGYERATHLILGLTNYIREDLKFTVEAYAKSFDDLIVLPDRSAQLYFNSGTGWARGVDFSLVKRFVNKFYGQVNYSFAQSKRDDNDGFGEYDSDFNQPHIFNILFGYEFNKEWSIAAKWRYATGRPEDGFIVHEDIFNDPNFLRYSKEITTENSDRLDSFHTLNFRLDYRKQLGRIALVSFLDIVNVYNHLNVNEDRFLYLSGLEDHRGFEILPTGGVKIEF